MTFLRRLSLLSLAVVCSTHLFAAVPLTNLVPETAPLVITAHDLPALVKAWNGSPWGRALQDEQMKKFLAPMRAKLKVDSWDEETKRETGYTVSELLDFGGGEILVAIEHLDRVPQIEKPDDLPVVVLVELGANAAKLDKLILDATRKEGEAPVSTEVFAGVTVYTQPFNTNEGEQDEAMSWAFVDGVGIFSWAKGSVLTAIDGVKNGGVENSFGKSERYLRARREMGETQVVFYANLQKIIPAIQAGVEARNASAQQEGGKAGVDIGSIFRAVGLDALDALYFGFNIGESSTDMAGGFTYLEERGIAKLLAYRDGPPPQPEWVPAKWTTVSIGRFSVREAYAAVEQMLAAFNPMIAGMVQTQIASFNKRVGIDLKRDLIGSLGDSLVSAYFVPQGTSPASRGTLLEMNQFVAISLENADVFTSALESIKGTMGPQADQLLKKREYLGYTIHTFEPPAGGRSNNRGFSYAITPKYLMLSVGSPAMVEAALQGCASSQPSIWEKPEVKAALADMPANACTFQYQDTGAIVVAMIETFARAAAATPPSAEDEGDESGGESATDSKAMFDFSARPDAALIAKYWSYSSGYARRDGNGLYFRSKLNHAK